MLKRFSYSQTQFNIDRMINRDFLFKSEIQCIHQLKQLVCCHEVFDAIRIM